MRFTSISAVALALVLSIGNALAVPTGKVEFEGGPMGKVTFDSKVHSDKGLKCADCHMGTSKLFEMKKGKDKITMAAMNEGKFCGACHDGKKAHSVKAPDACAKCHKK
jgi:c(7)-type cytochrome triheme protein